jgi:hypothetical protein
MCSYSGFSLAIPMDNVSSIFLSSGNAENKRFEYNPENRNTYISLPVIFDRHSSKIRHGIILNLSHNTPVTEENNDIMEDKIILLSTEIESERYIPSKKFYPIPKALKHFNFSSFFKGMYLENTISNINASELVLLLNPEQLVQNIQKESIT